MKRLVLAAAVLVGGCADGEAPAAPSADAAPSSDAPDATSGGSDVLIFPQDDGGEPYSSCLDIKNARPDSVDGSYVTSVGTLYCDMTTDGGGWTLVTEAMIASSGGKSVTPVNTKDERGGLALQVYANATGCVDGDGSRHQVIFKDTVAWTRIRVDYTFAGQTSCWGILGNAAHAVGLTSTLVPFERDVDVLRNPRRMGGSAGDAFDGVTARCDNETTNFWHSNNGSDPRSVTAILRRASVSAPAGLTLGVNCTAGGAETTSPTWWKYQNIYVR